ncbi:sec-independent protein translocase protein TatC [Halorubrum aquaticum]|uniref:Sec-independent protein translocase protein TatC n=1 Tax=Halorubrum aquaticum TaxID=387340 RepID=A0A1I2ZU63_9EURY|nr:twin-arginine translocase subunit TatC [Halorubrum aquaticum]SFH41324.1 sec-independent protein translocase protein TatC [Halorubrum aquaticum]
MDDDDRPSDEPSDPEDLSPSVESRRSTTVDDEVLGEDPASTDEEDADGNVEEETEGVEGDEDGGDEIDDEDGPDDDEDGPDDDATDGEDEDDTDENDTTDGDDEDDATDGGTPATAGDAEDLGGIQGPETDEEMPLAEHIEEMMRRLAVVFLFGGLATLVAVTESTELINYFWGYHIPAPLENRPRLYGPLELPLTRLKVAGLAGVVVGLPAFVYQTYRFMKPGLYENERRYYLAAVPTSLVLGGIGIAFAHFLVLPAIFSYFTTYTSDAATIAFGLAETFNLIVIMLAFMAIVFQIPLFIMLAIMMNLVTRQWLQDKRLIFWGSFLGIAFLFSPDPTGMAPIIVTLTMIVLFEGTLAILRWTGN